MFVTVEDKLIQYYTNSLILNLLRDMKNILTESIPF